MAFVLITVSPQMVFAEVSPDTYDNTHPDATTDSTDPTTFNIPTESPTGTLNAVGIPSQSSETVEKMKEGQGYLANNLVDLLISAINAVFNFLGLYSVDQLAENTMGNFWGALSAADMKTVSPFVTAFTVIAWMVAGVSIQLFSMKLAASTMNARRRASVIDYFQNWLLGAVLLAVGPRAINMIFQASSAVIKAMYMSIGERPFNPITDVFTALANKTSSLAGTGLAVVVYLLVVTGVTVMLNFIYLQRYVTLYVYAVLSPVFVSFYFFDKTRTLFWNWIKELIGLAFMPAVHMVLIAIYMTIAGTTSGSNMLLQLVFLVMFIPMSEMVRKLTSISGGNSGVAENLLGGMGMGVAMQGVRTITGATGAITGGGMAESVLFGAGISGSGNNGSMVAATGGGKMSGGRMGGGSSTGGSASSPTGFFGRGDPATGAGNMEQMMSAVSLAKGGFGAKAGGFAGAIAGGLIGAGTGNMGGIEMGTAAGLRVGGKIGRYQSGKAAGQREVYRATHPKGELGEDLYEGLSDDERQERAFGPGPDAPSDMSPEMRQNITARNMAMVLGDNRQASQLNAQINSDLGGMREKAHSMGLGENDNLISMGYSDHTDYYKTNSDGAQEWLYSSQQGNKNATGGRAVRTEFSVGADRSFKEVNRSIVSVGDIKGNSGLPQGWNT
jgi:Type IV secretory pathway, VirB6 components